MLLVLLGWKVLCGKELIKVERKKTCERNIAVGR
jgi:hypothetical protein